MTTATAPAPAPHRPEHTETSGQRVLRTLLTQRIALLAVLVVVVVGWFFALDAGGYLTADYDLDYMSATLINAVPLAMLGLAQLLVILSGRGGIDLSVGAIVSLSGMVFGFAYGLWGWPLWLAILATAGFGALCGALNGFLVAYVGFPALIATLATFYAYKSLAIVVNDQSPISTPPVQELFSITSSVELPLFGRYVPDVPLGLFTFLLPTVVLVWLLVARTAYGRRLYAIGTNDVAARWAGLPVRRTRFAAYTYAGLISGLVAVVTVAQFASARPDAGVTGNGMALPAITIAVLGGVAITGGIGRVAGVVLATLLVVWLNAGILLAFEGNAGAQFQLLALGAVLVFAALLNGVTTRRYGGTRCPPPETRTDMTDPLDELDGFTIEVPSWAYGNSGTRFKVFSTPGVPRDPFEKIDDAARVHALTGLAPRVSLHIPWDRVDDFGALATHAKERGVRIGAINSNLFQDEDYKLGSLTHADPRVRAKAVAHHVECVEVMREVGSTDLKLWLPDGTNYAGQDSLRARQDRLADSLRQIYAALGEDRRLLLEYKFFEPYFYATDIPDWGTSLLHCLALGERAQVVLDTGHHAPGTNIEFVVVQLLRAGRLGAFDFNSRYYADDDLVVGSADPFQLFRILAEIVDAGAHRPGSGVNFMLDQCHNIEEKIPGQIRSVLNVEQALAKALLVDRAALAAAQRAGDVLGAHAVLMDAYETDVRSRLADRREARGLPRDPMAAYAASGYGPTTAAERVGGTPASWGS